MDFKVSVGCITGDCWVLPLYSASMTLRHGYPKQAMDTRCYPCLCSNGQMHLDLVVSGCDRDPNQPGMTDEFATKQWYLSMIKQRYARGLLGL